MIENEISKKEFSLADFLLLLRRNLWIILLACILGTLVGYVVAEYGVEKQYEQKIGFMLDYEGSTDDPSVSESSTILSYTNGMVYNCIEVMQHNLFLTELNDRLVSYYHSESYPIAVLSNMISYETKSNTAAIYITITSDSPETSLMVARAIEDVILGGYETSEVVNNELVVAESYISKTFKKLLIKHTEEAKELSEEETIPSFPNVFAFSAIGLACGAIISILVLLIIALVDTRVDSEEELIGEFSIPVVGIVPVFPMSKEEQKKIRSIKAGTKRSFNVINDDSPFALVEAFRNIKTNIGFSIPKIEKNEARVVCITSADMGDGKSTIVSNTALAFAKSNIKTLIIDADMRKPKINKFFKTSNEKGLSDYLSGEAKATEVINKTEHDYLYTISAGSLPPNPIELLASKGMTDLVTELKSQFAVIIIDTPPVETVSDSLVLSHIVDGCLLVVKYRKTAIQDIYACLRKTQFADMKILGFVLNNVTESGKGGYKYGYGYKYGEGYSYSDAKNQGEKDDD